MAKFSQTEGLYKKEDTSVKKVLRKSEGLYESVVSSKPSSENNKVEQQQTKVATKTTLHS